VSNPSKNICSLVNKKMECYWHNSKIDVGGFGDNDPWVLLLSVQPPTNKKTAFATAAGCDYRRGFQPLTIFLFVSCWQNKAFLMHHNNAPPRIYQQE